MLRQIGKFAYFAGVRFGGLGDRRMRRISKRGDVVILNLHRVTPEENEFWPPMHPGVFRGLIEFLHNSFTVCRLKDLPTIHSDRPLAVLSFDDGYYDFFQYALPILREYGMPSNMNVIPECVLSGKPIWNVQLYDYLHSTSVGEINQLVVPGFDEKLNGGSAQQKVRFGVALSGYLKRRPRLERQQLWSDIESTIAGSKRSTRMMNAAEIREISQWVEIGAHSYSHESMGYESDEFFQSDLQQCEDFFASSLEMPLEIYAFPNGSYRPDQIDYLKKKGIKHVLLVDEEVAARDAAGLARMTVYGSTSNEAAMRSLGFSF